MGVQLYTMLLYARTGYDNLSRLETDLKPSERAGIGQQLRHEGPCLWKKGRSGLSIRSTGVAKMALINRLYSLATDRSISDERRAASGRDHPPLHSVLAPSFGAQVLLVAENVEKKTHLEEAGILW